MKHKIILLALLLISSNLTIGLLYPKAKATRISDKIVSASPDTIWVPDNYTKIEDAISAASSGDVIRVRAGTYYERFIIRKSVSLIGENKSTTIIDGSAKGTVVCIYANNVRFSGFTVQNSGSGILWPDTGIRIQEVSDNTVDNNIVTNNEYGIRVDWGHRNTVFNNTVVSNNNIGISIDFYSSNNNVSNNIVSLNNNNGISVRLGSNNNTVSRNTVTLHTYEYGGLGIQLRDSSNNKVTDNNATSNIRNIVASGSSGNSILNNYLRNGVYGVGFWAENDDYIINNTVINNSIGIHLAGANEPGSFNCTVNGNIILYSSMYGIRIMDSGDNIVINNYVMDNWCGISIYPWGPCDGDGGSNKTLGNNTIFHNNLINNTIQAYLGYKDELGYEPPNKWNNGYPSGGNYWSNYTGVDLDRDGIGDSPHVIDTNNTDNYPLMGMFSSFNTPIGKPINIVSNSTVEDFEYSKSNSTIKMQVSNMTANQTYGFCRACIPHALMSEPYNVTIDGANPMYWNYTLYDNGTYRWIYFTYQHSAHEVIIKGSDTAPPIISILSPENKVFYPENNIFLILTIDEPTDWLGYSLNGQTNVTILGNTTLTSLVDGAYYVVVYTNDTAGNMGASGIIMFWVDTTPPNITSVVQIPPKDNVLPEDEVTVNVEVEDNISGWQWLKVILNYTTNNGTWFTISMTYGEEGYTATIPQFPYCTNVTYIIIAEDNATNTVTSEEMGYDTQYHVIPEFPSTLILPLLMIVTLIAVVVRKTCWKGKGKGYHPSV